MVRSYTITRPDCYGDSDEYSETSSHCRTCPFVADCSEAIDKSINQQAIRSANMVTPRKYYTSSSTSSSSSPSKSLTKTTSSNGNALMRPVKFNHSKPLAAQYATYVGYDVAEAMASRAVDLVRSCRNEYERELHSQDGQNAQSGNANADN
jgi:hypothetical protein